MKKIEIRTANNVSRILEKIVLESKSLEQLENDYWKEPSEFPTNMVERCYRYRKISVADLTNEQLRLLISQKIGLEYLTEIALDKLEQNILTEGNIYEGNLQFTVNSSIVPFVLFSIIEQITFLDILSCLAY